MRTPIYYVQFIWVADILCWTREIFTWKEEKHTEKRKDSHPPPQHLTWPSDVVLGGWGFQTFFQNPTHPLNVLYDQVMLVRGWMRGSKKVSNPIHPWTSYMTSHIGQGKGGGLKKFLTPNYPLNILHDKSCWSGGGCGVLKKFWTQPTPEHLKWTSNVHLGVGGVSKKFQTMLHVWKSVHIVIWS